MHIWYDIWIYGRQIFSLLDFFSNSMLSSNYIQGKNKCCVFTGIELVSYLEVDLTYGRNGKAKEKELSALFMEL